MAELEKSIAECGTYSPRVSSMELQGWWYLGGWAPEDLKVTWLITMVI